MASTCPVVAMLLAACDARPAAAPPPTTQSAPAATTTAPQAASQSAGLSALNEGHAHLARRDLPAAAAAFRAALDADPQSAPARINLGLVLLLDDRFAEASATLAPAARGDDATVQAEYLYGLALLRDERAVAALEPLGRAARRDPADVSLLFQYAVALERAGRTDEALAAYREVLELDRFHVTAPHRMAQIERLRGNADEAERLRLRSERHREILGRDAAHREAQGINRCFRPLAPPAGSQPDPAGGGGRFVEVGGGVGAAAERDRGPVGVGALLAGAEGEALLGVKTGGGWATWTMRGGELVRREAAVEAAAPERIRCAAVGDFDNDGLADVLFVAEAGCLLLRQSAPGRFADAPIGANLGGERGALDACWVDLDHDGDLDILLARGEDGLAFLQNRGDGTFEDATGLLAFPRLAGGRPLDARALAVGEINDDDAVDVAVAGRAGAAVLFNTAGGDFASKRLPPIVVERAALGVRIDDVNNDGTLDAAFALVEADGGVQVRFSDAGIREIDVGTTPVEDLLLIDYDDDGFLDVLVVGASGPRLWRNLGQAGWREVTRSLGLDAPRSAEARHPAELGAEASKRSSARSVAADLDGDGDLDLVVMTPGEPARWWRNEIERPGRALRLALQGLKSNRSAVGTRVEARAGRLRVFRGVSGPLVRIGVADASRLDSLSLIWPSGITDAYTAIDVGPQVRALIEPDVMLGSCPYLYVWDGAAFRFVTDVLGNAPLGLHLTRDVLLHADVDEIVALGGSDGVRPARPPTDGPALPPRYAVEITSEMNEVAYLDAARLLVVDHPPDSEVHPVDRLMPPPFPPSEVWQIANVRPPRVARLDPGDRDVTELLRAIDGRRVAPPRRRESQKRGWAEHYALTLDFGPLAADRPLVLIVSGWLQYGDASINVAASQNPGLGNPFPRLEAETVDGGWTPVDLVVGAVAGKPKSFVVDLGGRLPHGVRRLRLSAAVEHYWDRLAVGERRAAWGYPAVGAAPAGDGNDWTVQELRPAAAELRWRGVSRTVRASREEPLLPVYGELAERRFWRHGISGWCTRYGDVLELLREAEGALAVFNGGDALRIEFDALAAAPPAPGRVREYFLYTVGWEKDSDHHIRAGDSVEPLPMHGMDDQQYGRDGAPRPWPDWADRYNTRRTPAE